MIDEIVKPLNEAEIPFSSTHGVSLVYDVRSHSQMCRKNHDNEPNITHVEEILREQNVAPLSYTRMSPDGVGGEGGPGNYWVPVRVCRVLSDIASYLAHRFTKNKMVPYRLLKYPYI